MKNGSMLILAMALSLGLAACGKGGDNATAGAAPAASQPAPAASLEDQNPVGAKTFKTVCSMCHQSGAAGAPVFGNKQDWAPRIAEGKDTLYKHALEGFTGSKGTMPAHGGNPSLKDEEVKAAVDYMVAKAS
ncbi:MAG: cytochrome c5 family protein [Paludibacterium sp.]|uniref:c-type cytochrome n=1 Tax=Paludibacterium sp. TaxID=1917523 RepID=UPI0025D86B8E|nr:c-type cytochrome [Paludibacterium sp.]MBV8045952.1 cytochrome c5 family protein [Paludibacterium sp.]MBV8646126.1 cytochrome c5 family protein [Paludibacterium sp.]